MSIQVRILKDELSPAAAKLKAGLNPLTKVLEAVGEKVVSISKQAFVDASLRATPWAPKTDGSPATLIKDNVLRESIRITSVGATSVTVGTDRVYAAIHQFGGTIEPKPGKKFLVFQIGGVKVFARKVTIPPRPFFPITPSGTLTPLAQEKVAAVLEQAIGTYL